MKRAIIMACSSLLASLTAIGQLDAESPPSWRSYPEGTLQLLVFGLTREIANREPSTIKSGAQAVISADGKRVYAYLEVLNKGTPRSLEVVWKRGEQVYHRARLSVGRSPSWRTWAFIDARPSLTGPWSVAVLDEEGSELRTMNFTIE